jgi:hypothetical protein
MKTNKFLDLLKQNENKALIFEYQKGKIVSPNYQITEVKNVTFITTDCGGKQNNWQETQVQLWENPSNISKKNFMKTNKALSIFNIVDSITPLLLNTEIKIEYGNTFFHTAILKIADYFINNDTLVFYLFEQKTKCKASEKPSQTCC